MFNEHWIFSIGKNFFFHYFFKYLKLKLTWIFYMKFSSNIIFFLFIFVSIVELTSSFNSWHALMLLVLCSWVFSWLLLPNPMRSLWVSFKKPQIFPSPIFKIRSSSFDFWRLHFITPFLKIICWRSLILNNPEVLFLIFYLVVLLPFFKNYLISKIYNS